MALYRGPRGAGLKVAHSEPAAMRGVAVLLAACAASAASPINLVRRSYMPRTLLGSGSDAILITRRTAWLLRTRLMALEAFPLAPHRACSGIVGTFGHQPSRLQTLQLAHTDPADPLAQQQDILDFLWKPGFGASLHICKIEIGVCFCAVLESGRAFTALPF